MSRRTKADQMLDVFLAIGSAHAGEPLTHEALLERFRGHPDDPERDAAAAAFRAKFNGQPPAEVTFQDEEAAALAAEFENAGRRS